MIAKPALVVSAIAAVVAAAMVAALRGRAATDDGVPAPSSLIWILFAAAALCVAGLTHRRAPSIAWIGIVLALTIATLDLAAFGREHRAAADAQTWTWFVVVTCLGALLATLAAAAYAAKPDRRVGRWVVPFAVAVVGLVAATGVYAIATADPSPPPEPSPPLGTLRIATRALLAAIAVLLGLGIVGDLRPAARRTRTRLGVAGSGPGWSSRRHRANDALRIFVDEITPGRARARRAATAERSRIAVELHADVVPSVRRALSEAERGGSAEQLALALREVLGELDDLATDRRSVVLQESGLLAAIERLAERTEERSDVRVTIDVPDTRPDPGVPARPPREVETAALRVAQLALENVIRHAPSASATIQVTADPTEVMLAISDDGPGIPADDAPSAATGRRGLADMRTEAAACGATLTTGGRLDGPGTIIRFDWRAA